MTFAPVYYEVDNKTLEVRNTNVEGMLIGDMQYAEYEYNIVTDFEVENWEVLLKTPYPTKIIFNDPATVVFWSDKTKTVVKAMPGDIYDPEKGVAMCFMKRMLGDDYRKCLNWVHDQTKKPIDEGALNYILRALKKLPTKEVTNE
jgi:hypothetical protein